MAAWGSNAFLAAVQVSINQTQVLYPELGSLETRVSKFYLDELFAGEHNSSMNDTGTYWQLSYPNSLPLLPVSVPLSYCSLCARTPIHCSCRPCTGTGPDLEETAYWFHTPEGARRWSCLHSLGHAVLGSSIKLYLCICRWLGPGPDPDAGGTRGPRHICRPIARGLGGGGTGESGVPVCMRGSLMRLGFFCHYLCC